MLQVRRVITLGKTFLQFAGRNVTGRNVAGGNVAQGEMSFNPSRFVTNVRNQCFCTFGKLSQYFAQCVVDATLVVLEQCMARANI